MKEALCWSCQKTNRYKCSWFAEAHLLPPGAEAIEQNNGYRLIIKCPDFLADHEEEKPVYHPERKKIEPWMSEIVQEAFAEGWRQYELKSILHCGERTVKKIMLGDGFVPGGVVERLHLIPESKHQIYNIDFDFVDKVKAYVQSFGYNYKVFSALTGITDEKIGRIFNYHVDKLPIEEYESLRRYAIEQVRTTELQGLGEEETISDR